MGGRTAKCDQNAIEVETRTRDAREDSK